MLGAVLEQITCAEPDGRRDRGLEGHLHLHVGRKEVVTAHAVLDPFCRQPICVLRGCFLFYISTVRVERKHDVAGCTFARLLYSACFLASTGHVRRVNMQTSNRSAGLRYINSSLRLQLGT